MTDLLAEVLEAHGGVARWNAFSRVEATIVTGGNSGISKANRKTPRPVAWP
ncbi:hypothetical protein OKHIL_11610 [Mycolicibacterium mageritense]